MGDKTGIAWTDATWNPVTGCTKVSAGCKHCYADRVFPRAYHGQDVTCARCDGTGWAYYARLDNGFNYDDGVRRCKECDGKGSRPRKFTDVQCHPERLDQPLRWRKPRRIFVNSMSDLFHPDVPDDFIAQVFAVMALTPRHTFQILTKRPERMRELLTDPAAIGGYGFRNAVYDQALVMAKAVKSGRGIWRPWSWPLPNVWMGTSAEDQPTFDLRVPFLRETPAAVRFVSLEPMLGAIEVSSEIPNEYPNEQCRCGNHPRDDSDDINTPCIECGFEFDRSYLDWVIVGGESGPKARPFDIKWARDVVHQCEAAGVPVFVKQDYGPRSGMQGRFTDDEWALKEYPHAS